MGNLSDAECEQNEAMQVVSFGFTSTFGCLLDLLILITYMRYSNRLDHPLTRKGINILMNSGSSSAERVRAQQRHEFYTEVANQ